MTADRSAIAPTGGRASRPPDGQDARPPSGMAETLIEAAHTIAAPIADPFRFGMAAGLEADPGVPAADLRNPRPVHRTTGLRSRWLHRRCAVCGHTFRPGDQVVICPCDPVSPRCRAAVHRDLLKQIHCWELWQGSPLRTGSCLVMN